ncbi:MAG: hypothetical protein ACQPRJ_05450 [Solitalea-like symbiont of Acarus siro]
MAITRLKRKNKRNKRAVFLLKQRIKKFTDVEIKDRAVKPKNNYIKENIKLISELEQSLSKTA